ncbi:MAG TPA: molybdopterin-binding protein [Cytophagales bacterium]|jgi:hypothetical protein|nr:molybdopterin-binding protein [Cytophagales bacterium]
MKKLLTILFVLIGFYSLAQNTITTDHFTVTGLVKKEFTFTLSFLENFESKPFSDVVITNHKGDKKGTIKNLHVISLKDILKDVEPNEDNPKLLSEFYITFIASDDYKVVYSWNEIFNSPTGDSIFIITSKDGKKMNEMRESILMITPTDYNTGRRYIKGLSKIVFSRLNK